MPEMYTVSVENKFHTLLREADEDQSPNDLWEGMKEAVLSAAEETIPKRRRQKHLIADLADKFCEVSHRSLRLLKSELFTTYAMLRLT